jgi:hypothetical protein
LPQDEANFRATQAQLEDRYFEVFHLPAVLGRTLPGSVCVKLTRDPNSVNNKGAIGCMLSHLNVWEHVRGMQAPFALVLEDDVLVKNPQRLETGSLPPDFDLAFCNDRMVTGDDESPNYLPIATEMLPRVEANGKSVGGDSYLLSPRGARKLVEYFNRDLYFGHVDVRMLAYCLQTSALKKSVAGALTRELAHIREIVNHDMSLEGYVCTSKMFRHMNAESRRAREDALGKEAGLVPRHQSQ